MAFPPSVDALPQISECRLEIARMDFAAAVRKANDGLSRSDINQVQRERLHLLRAEAFHGMQDYERALRDAITADEVAEGQSPQAHFIRGRELFCVFRLQEAKDAFDMAEILMLTPTPLRYSSLDNKPASRETAWANVGKAKSLIAADATVPKESQSSGRNVTYEWVQDLARWRHFRDECNAALTVQQTKLVPRAVLSITLSLMERRLSQKSSRYVVLLIRNDTTEPLVFDFHKFKEGQFMEGCALPHVIPPLSMAIGGAHATGWLSGVRGSVAFRLKGTHTLLFSFDCPLTSSYSSKACIVSKSSVQSSGSLSPNAKQVSVAQLAKDTYRVSASAPTTLQAFSVTRLNNIRLSPADVAAIFDFLPPAAMRKATAVSRAWRQLCMRVPPCRFYGLAHAFPDYRLASDFTGESCWSVRDVAGVKWSVKSEPTFNDERNISFVDSSDQKIFTLTCDVFARASNAILYYGSRKSPVLAFEESFFRSTRKTTVKMGSRTVMTLVGESTVVEMFVEVGGSKQETPLLTLDRSSDTLYVIRDRKKAEVAKVVMTSRAARKSSIVADLIMNQKSDALLCCVIAFYALFRAS